MSVKRVKLKQLLCGSVHVRTLTAYNSANIRARNAKFWNKKANSKYYRKVTRT